MNKKILLIAATVFILSCSILPPQKAEPTTALPAPTDAPQTGASPAGTANDALTGFMEVRLHPQDGNLEEMLAVEAGKAIAA